VSERPRPNLCVGAAQLHRTAAGPVAVGPEHVWTPAILNSNNVGFWGSLLLEQIADQRLGTDRRAKRLSIRFPDRRLGFVRRQIGQGRVRTAYDRMIGSYRHKPRSLALVLVAIAILNIADLALTWRALEAGAAELNPIMAALIDWDPLLATVFKATIVVAVVAVMWAMRRYRQVLEASLLLLGAFIVLTLYSASMLMIAG